MKYIVIFLMIIGLNANSNLELYKQEVNSLINYNLKIPNNIYDMFLVQKSINKKIVKKSNSKLFKIKPKKELNLLAILNNKILLKINNNNKWVKVGDKIGDYKILKVLNNNSIIILDNNKMRILSMNKKNNFKIKVR